MEDSVKGYKMVREKKKEILYTRMDNTMIEKLCEIRKRTGISTSEIIREAVRRLLLEADETGTLHLQI